MIHRIFVPIDGSLESSHALDVGIGMARALGASLAVGHVVDFAKIASMSLGEAQMIPGCYEALETEGEMLVARARDLAGAAGVPVQTFVVQGDTVHEILSMIQGSQSDWVVMGSHGRTGLSRLLLGSVAEGVLRDSGVPVMIVPRKAAVKGKSGAEVVEARSQ